VYEDSPRPAATPRRLPIGIQILAGLAGLLTLLVVSMLVAIGLAVGSRPGQTRLDDRDVPYVNAVAEAALNAKGVANDQRGFLLTGDPTFIDEAERRIADARRAFATADRVAADADQRDTVDTARAGFEQWVAAVHDEFAVFQAGDRQRAITASLGPERELRKSYERALADAQSVGDRSVRSARTSVAEAWSRSVGILIVCLVVALAVGIGVVYWLMRAVALPLFRLVAVLAPDLPA
jgi:methyl-accepting chemotaxis protein